MNAVPPSNPPFTIRRLGPRDEPAARALNAFFAIAFDDAEHYASAPPPDAYLERWLASPDAYALAALDGGEVVGGLTAYRLPKLEQARSEIYLYDLAVAESHRRRGIATALIRELQRLGAETDAWVVFVQADPEDTPAVALYTKLGTREDVFHFDLEN